MFLKNISYRISSEKASDGSVEDDFRPVRFFALYVATILIHYLLPSFVSSLFFFGVLIAFLRSKKDIFWIAYFICLIYPFGWLFHVKDVLFHLPAISFPGFDREIRYEELFMFTTYIKALFRKSIFPPRFFYILLGYSAFLMVLSFALGITLIKLLYTLRYLAVYGLVWSIPTLLRGSIGNYARLFHYFLVFTVPIVLSQFFVFVTGEHFALAIGGQAEASSSLSGKVFDSSIDLIRPLYASHLLLLNVAFCLSLFYEKTRGLKLFSDRWYMFLMSLSYFSLFVTGTRGYIIAGAVMFLIHVAFRMRSVINKLPSLVVGLTLVGGLLLAIPGVSTQLRLTVERLSTVLLIIEGDETAGGTLKRIDKRLPIVMEKFEERPVFGHAFSTEFFKYSDGHVAWPTLLLNGGIVGVILFLFFLAILISHVLSRLLNGENKNLTFILFAISAFMVVHSTSYIVFSYVFGLGNPWMFAVFLGFASVLIRERGITFKWG